MKSNIGSRYYMMIYKRSKKEQCQIRQTIIRYAQQYGNKPAARYYGCNVRTVRMWRKRFEKDGSKGLRARNKITSHDQCNCFRGVSV